MSQFISQYHSHKMQSRTWANMLTYQVPYTVVSNAHHAIPFIGSWYMQPTNAPSGQGTKRPRTDGSQVVGAPPTKKVRLYYKNRPIGKFSLRRSWSNKKKF